MSFSKKILLWYSENKRELPWRSTKDPYKIWLSEIMLQQTQVDRVIDFYNRGGGGASHTSKLVKPLGLTEQEKTDLLAFLKSLSQPLSISMPKIP